MFLNYDSEFSLPKILNILPNLSLWFLIEKNTHTKKQRFVSYEEKEYIYEIWNIPYIMPCCDETDSYSEENQVYRGVCAWYTNILYCIIVMTPCLQNLFPFIALQNGSCG